MYLGERLLDAARTASSPWVKWVEQIMPRHAQTTYIIHDICPTSHEKEHRVICGKRFAITVRSTRGGRLTFSRDDVPLPKGRMSATARA